MGSINPQYWQVNVPVEDWTDECPDFLQDLSPKDIGILSMTDSEFREKGLVLGWGRVKEIVHNGRIQDFKRLPSDLRRYKAFTHKLSKSPGGIMGYIIDTRLHWTLPIIPRGAPFQHEDDFKILYNDWPYGIDKDIVHLVVWTKFKLEEDLETTALTVKAWKQVEDFMWRTFRSKLPEGYVIWFRNTTNLKSVHSIEHFHVMLYRPDPLFLQELTNNDVPLFKQIASKDDEL